MHICKECTNFVQGKYHNRTLRKCKVYGLTHSEASDWAQKYEACGMFNKDYSGGRIIECVKRGGFRVRQETPIDGQLTFEGVTDNG